MTSASPSASASASTPVSPARVTPSSFSVTDDAVTGAPVHIERDGASAWIAPLGAGLRKYVRHGVDLVEPYGDDTIAPGAAGLLLAPWPNRVKDGKWTLNGETQQLDITEVSRNNASHGLLRNAGYTVLERDDCSATLSAEIFPQHGFPFRMTHEVTYRLTDEGHLVVEQRLTNRSAVKAPGALGAHPYLRIGDADPAGLQLTVDATTRLVADDRLIPVGSAPVGDEERLDQRPVQGFSTDTAYTDLAAQEVAGSGLEEAVAGTLEDSDGRSVTLWGDPESVRYLHVFVTKGLTGQGKSVAIEPMTAPADAFNSGDGLAWIEPGESLKMRWGISSRLGD